MLGSISPLPSKVSQQGDFSVGQRELTLDAISSDIWKTADKVPTELLHWFSVWFEICQSSYQQQLSIWDKQKKFWFTSKAGDSTGTPSPRTARYSLLDSQSLFLHPESSWLLTGIDTLQRILCDFHSPDLKGERKIWTLQSFHRSDESHCHIKLTWALESHRKSIKV